MKLSDSKIKSLKPATKLYRVADGYGLAIEVTPNGSKLWRWRYRMANGKPNMVSLGAYPVVTLSGARDKALELRRQKHAANGSTALPHPVVAQTVRELLPAARPAAPVLLAKFCNEWLSDYARTQSLTEETRGKVKLRVGYFVAELVSAVIQ